MVADLRGVPTWGGEGSFVTAVTARARQVPEGAPTLGQALKTFYPTVYFQ